MWDPGIGLDAGGHGENGCGENLDVLSPASRCVWSLAIAKSEIGVKPPVSACIAYMPYTDGEACSESA